MNKNHSEVMIKEARRLFARAVRMYRQRINMMGISTPTGYIEMFH